MLLNNIEPISVRRFGLLIGPFCCTYSKELVLDKKIKSINFADPLRYTFEDADTRETLYNNFFDNYEPKKLK